jgi:hypothetical protein
MNIASAPIPTHPIPEVFTPNETIVCILQTRASAIARLARHLAAEAGVPVDSALVSTAASLFLNYANSDNAGPLEFLAPPRMFPPTETPDRSLAGHPAGRSYR